MNVRGSKRKRLRLNWE